MRREIAKLYLHTALFENRIPAVIARLDRARQQVAKST
jgi:hypothetical protein